MKMKKKTTTFISIRNQSDSDSLILSVVKAIFLCAHLCCCISTIFTFTIFHILSHPAYHGNFLSASFGAKKVCEVLSHICKSSDKGNKMPKGRRWLIYWTSIANSSKTNITHFYHRLSEVLGLSIQWAKIFNSMKNSSKNKNIFLKGDYVEI